MKTAQKIIDSCITLEHKNGLNSALSKEALNEIYKRGGSSFCIYCEHGEEKINHHNITNCMSCCNNYETKFKMKKEEDKCS